MPDLHELLESEARRRQPGSRPPFEELVRARRARDRRGRIGAGALLVAVVAGAAVVPTVVSGWRSGAPVVGSSPASSPTRTVTARLTLPATSLRSGESLRGRITVENNLGREIRFLGCGFVFSVLPVGDGYHPAPAWPRCLQELTIPTGTTTYPVTVAGTYDRCAKVAQGDTPACLPDGKMPGLPPGQYAVTTFSLSSDVPLPAPVMVTVTP